MDSRESAAPDSPLPVSTSYLPGLMLRESGGEIPGCPVDFVICVSCRGFPAPGSHPPLISLLLFQHADSGLSLAGHSVVIEYP